jgi:nicotinamidase/pyrazinamidase
MQRYRAESALIVVDVQNDFADPAGNLSVAGADRILPTVNGEIAMATSAGAVVVATQDWHPESTPHFAKDGGLWPVHCVAGTWGAELHPDLALPQDAPRIRKGANGEDGYSGFNVRDPVTEALLPTELEALLRARGPGCRRRRSGHRLLRQGHRPRRQAAGVRDGRPDRRHRGRRACSG